MPARHTTISSSPNNVSTVPLASGSMATCTAPPPVAGTVIIMYRSTPTATGSWVLPSSPAATRRAASVTGSGAPDRSTTAPEASMTCHSAAAMRGGPGRCSGPPRGESEGVHGGPAPPRHPPGRAAMAVASAFSWSYS